MEILVADDVSAVRSVLRAALERWGHRVTVAEDGRQAVEAARGRRFDVALLDVDMPALDGLAARDEIAEVCPDTVFVFMTGGEHASEIGEATSNAGRKATLLRKPFALETLKRVVEESGVKPTASLPCPQASGDKLPPFKRVALSASPTG